MERRLALLSNCPRDQSYFAVPRPKALEWNKLERHGTVPMHQSLASGRRKGGEERVEAICGQKSQAFFPFFRLLCFQQPRGFTTYFPSFPFTSSSLSH